MSKELENKVIEEEKAKIRKRVLNKYKRMAQEEVKNHKIFLDKTPELKAHIQELQNKYGVNPSRLSAAGRGEYNPVSDNDTAEGRAKNRRTQIIITPKLDQFLDLIDKAPEAEE